ncbi:uncharacterized protein N7515_007107 [Penicillium bovifimosum]|uniref:Rhodopsin domain-containing protein n=1 Tax=Penicillium bovifimosum TaxID=126998 RepID=A0A9W9GW78_9EURO|nr:uncharacterized protein N7515_007107 [Penicillium bovifimosum]KAJ5131068.1 hypothetical protein N7515_007107 [Penicillium bovifimosum]
MTVTAENLYDDKGPKILAVLWTLTGLTTIIVIARVYIRLALLRNFGVDDYLIVVSTILGLTYCVITTVGVNAGFGKHAMYLTQDNLEFAILLNVVSFLFGILSFTLPKLAVTAMLNRILNPSSLMKTILWMMTGTAAVVSIICIIILFTMCNPPEALWHVSLMEKGATCKSTEILIDYAIFTGGRSPLSSLSAIVDLSLAIYPVTVLLKLQMSLRKRIALCAALGLGSIASAMAIIKCTQLNGLADHSDYTYGTADLVMWTNIEADVVTIASCIPTLQPLLEIILGKRGMGSYSQGKGDHYKGSSNFHPSFNRTKQSSKQGKDDLGFTNIDSQGSQESILAADNDQNKNSHAMGHIHRTDDVTISYESTSKLSPVSREYPAGSSW